MEKAKKLSFVLLLIIAIACIVPFPVAHANSAPEPRHNYFVIAVTNAGDDVKYAQLLIQSNINSSDYRVCEEVDVSENGSNVFLPIDSNKTIDTITSQIKISLLDENKNVMKTSDAASIVPMGRNLFAKGVTFDASGTALTVDFFRNYYSDISLFMLYTFLIIPAVSTVIETLIAIPFQIKPLRRIVIVNIITQILLIIFIFIFSPDFRYTSAVILGEIIVFVAEYVAYIFLFKNKSKANLSVYTFVANTASLIFGLSLNAALNAYFIG